MIALVPTVAAHAVGAHTCGRYHCPLLYSPGAYSGSLGTRCAERK